MISESNNSYSPNPIVDDTIDFKRYLFGILANWYWFILSIFVCLGISWLINRYSMPVYRVSGSLIISEDKGRGLTGYENMIPGMEIYRTQKAVLNEIEILKSFDLARRTLSSLNFNISYMGVGRSGFKEAVLYNSSPFIIIPDSSKKNLRNYPVYVDILSKTQCEIQVDEQFKIKQKIAFGDKFESGPFNFTIILRDPKNFSPESTYSRYYFKFNNLNTLANSYKSSLTISTNDQKRGSVLFLSLSGNNPQQISDYLNKLMEVYSRKGLDEKNETARKTVEFIDEQLEILDASLKNAELEVQNFRLENRLIDVKTEGNKVENQLVYFEEKKVMAELQNRYLKYLEEYVNDRNNLNQVVVPSLLDISDPLLSQLIMELNAQLSKKEELLFTVNPGNPKIIIADSKIDLLRSSLQDNIQSLMKNNSITIGNIEQQLSLAEKDLEKFPVTERLYINFQRQYKVNDQIYTYLLQKRAEAAIAKAANVSDNRPLDYARVENASLISPKTRTNNMLGLLIGLILPLSLLVLLDLLINKISSRSDIERKTSVPIISTIGHNEGLGDIPVFENPKSALAESFRGLRTNLQYLLREKEQKVIAITSTITGEGKTFCSANLAVIFAMAGKKTLLMGMDLRKPKIHRLFNLDNHIGISTYLIGKTDIKEMIRETKIQNLFIAPSGPVPPNPAELLESNSMKTLLVKLRDQFDIIILDTPPFGMVTDARLLARLVDLNLFIVRQNYSPINILELIEELFRKKEIGSMGIIMNDIKHKGYYGYGYRYYNYGESYGYGYYYNYGKYEEEKS